MELEQSLGQLFDHPSQLRLVNAAEQIRVSTNVEMTLTALTFLRLKAMQLDTEAKTKLSTIYAEGQKDVIEKDQDEADLWSRSVFDKQLNQALVISTDDLITIGKQQPPKVALSTTALIMAGAEQGVPTLCYLAGIMLTKGVGCVPDIDRGLAFLERAGEQKQPDAAYELGRFYSDRYNYSRPDLKQSLYWYQRAYENGDTRALVDLAYGFSEGDLGHDVPRDDDRAFRYAEQGAKTDDKYCQYILGHLYLKGRGVVQDSEKAVHWLSASAEQGFAVALEEISAIYLKGHGDVPKNYQLAHDWCLKGVSTTAYCQTSLGDIYRNGWGVQRDYQKAFQYYQTAAIQPDSPHHYAQHMLGEMFLNGEGVPQDLAVAREWFQIASGQGYEPSRLKLQILAATKSIVPAESSPRNSSSPNGSTRSSLADIPPTPQPVQEKRSSRWSIGFFNKKKTSS